MAQDLADDPAHLGVAISSERVEQRMQLQSAGGRRSEHGSAAHSWIHVGKPQAQLRPEPGGVVPEESGHPFKGRRTRGGIPRLELPCGVTLTGCLLPIYYVCALRRNRGALRCLVHDGLPLFRLLGARRGRAEEVRVLIVLVRGSSGLGLGGILQTGSFDFELRLLPRRSLRLGGLRIGERLAIVNSIRLCFGFSGLCRGFSLCRRLCRGIGLCCGFCCLHLPGSPRPCLPCIGSLSARRYIFLFARRCVRVQPGPDHSFPELGFVPLARGVSPFQVEDVLAKLGHELREIDRFRAVRLHESLPGGNPRQENLSCEKELIHSSADARKRLLAGEGPLA